MLLYSSSDYQESIPPTNQHTLSPRTMRCCHTQIKGNYKQSVWENWSSAICFSQIGKSRLSCLPHAGFSIIFLEFSISILTDLFHEIGRPKNSLPPTSKKRPHTMSKNTMQTIFKMQTFAIVKVCGRRLVRPTIFTLFTSKNMKKIHQHRESQKERGFKQSLMQFKM